MAKAPLANNLDSSSLHTPLIYVESSEWQRVQGGLLTAVENESEKIGEERRIILKKGKFSPLEAYDYQLQRWTREHECLKQKVQGNNTVAEIEWLETVAKFPFCLLLDDMQGRGHFGDGPEKIS